MVFLCEATSESWYRLKFKVKTALTEGGAMVFFISKQWNTDGVLPRWSHSFRARVHIGLQQAGKCLYKDVVWTQVLLLNCALEKNGKPTTLQNCSHVLCWLEEWLASSLKIQLNGLNRHSSNSQHQRFAGSGSMLLRNHFQWKIQQAEEGSGSLIPDLRNNIGPVQLAEQFLSM